jgi:long-chain acyl-CoA synthetase
MHSILYDLWQEIVRAQPGSMALHDLASHQSWTFANLDQVANQTPLPPGSIIFPQERDPTFLFTLLAAWRKGRVVCPLDPGQSPPSLSSAPLGCVHLKLTSATTGAPRLIGFTADQLLADVNQILATMGLRPDWPNLAVLSLAHSYGFSSLILPLLLRGIPLALCPTALPQAVSQAAHALGTITLPAVPALWKAWHEAGAIHSSIQLAISAGAPLPLSLERAVHADHSLKIHNFYGASECGGIAYDRSLEPRSDPACVGSTLTGVDIQCAHDGRLIVRSQAVGQTYWPEPDPSLAHGQFYTSDLARIHHDLLYLCGRAGDVINVAGRKVLPEEIERLILAHPDVRECLIFGVPIADSSRGDTIVCVAACSPSTDAAALRQFLLPRLPAWQIPREWILVETLHRNQRGKLSRADWRRRYLALQGRSSPSPATIEPA